VKFILWFVFSLLILFASLIPEMAMYFLWNLVSPETEAGKVGLVAVFAVCGGGLCILFGWIGLMLWVYLTDDFLNKNRFKL